MEVGFCGKVLMNTFYLLEISLWTISVRRKGVQIVVVHANNDINCLLQSLNPCFPFNVRLKSISQFRSALLLHTDTMLLQTCLHWSTSSRNWFSSNCFYFKFWQLLGFTLLLKYKQVRINAVCSHEVYACGECVRAFKHVDIELKEH